MPRNIPQRRETSLEDRAPKVHPIWRGVGFVFMILAPIIGYAASELILAENQKAGWFSIPQNLIVQWQDPNILVKLIIMVFIALVLYALFTLIYFIIMRVAAPSRYGPYDVPPARYKGKPYKR